MNIQKWVSLFFKTLILGCVIGLIVGIASNWSDLLNGFSDGHILSFFIQLFVLFVLGGLFSVLSQMGFFAYLTVHRIALGIFRTHTRWSLVQVLLIAFVFFDLVYFRYAAFADKGSSVWGYFVIPIVLLIVSVVIAGLKKRDTNRYAYIPTFFFMFVVTAIEWIPDLRYKDNNLIWVMGITLIICNAYQVLKLHRLIKED